MKGNDLGNFMVPRDVLVWEGLLGLLPDPQVAGMEARFRQQEKWDDAVGMYSINTMLARKIWDITWRGGREIDLLTFLGGEFAEALERRVEREGLPLRRIHSEEPNDLARGLAYQPDLRAIYDPDPSHQFLYGAKGRILGPDQYTMFGEI